MSENQFNTASSFFTNEAILAGLGFPTVCRNPNPEIIKCPSCKEDVLPEDFNDEYQLCVDCYHELSDEHNMPPFEGMDQGDVCEDR